MKHRHPASRRAFTLIELLTVIAVIGILASILIPTVGAARTAANKAKTRTQFAGYINALQQFKSTYGYWPTVFEANGSDDEIGINDNTADFVAALSGRDENGDRTVAGGNRRAAPFYSFADDEYDDDGNLVDAFGNELIRIRVDGDGNGQLTVPGENEPIKAKVVIWSEANETENLPAVYSWD
ncbi:MAG: type II secretion system protein [Puniceicoccales bacterium]